MKKYILTDLENFEKDEKGFIICPTGDYTSIKNFPLYCDFGNGCRFCNSCSFGEWCDFGKRCSFGEDCSFGEWCSFGEDCSFGERCDFGKRCSFGEDCSFGKRCSFGEDCSFGEWCSFGNGCKCEDNHEFEKLFQIGYIGSRDDTTQFWLLTNKSILVRCGCFCGNIDKFIESVKKKHGDTSYAKEYLAAMELAKLHFQKD